MNNELSTTVASTPNFTIDQAEQLLQTHYGLSATAHALPSERDQNFRMTTADGTIFVLKIANRAEEHAMLECQNQVMAHVLDNWPGENATTACPYLHLTLAGQAITTIQATDDTSHFMRLLSYLPGKPLAQVKPHSPNLLHSLGSFLGQLDHALVGFDHPAAHRNFYWDLQQAEEVIQQYLPEILDSELQVQVQHFYDRFQQNAVPHLPSLRTGVIHSDGNDYNMLAQLDHNMGSRVTGIIDFGDMVHSYIVGEVAIAAAYVMLNKEDPLAAAAHVVRGYHAAYPLTEIEIATLYDLICIRLCTSVCMGAHQQSQAPDNEYLGISQAPVRRALNQLEEIHPNLAHYVFRDTCGLAPCPQTEAIIHWLGSQHFASVVDADLTTPDQQVLDLSIDSPLLGQLADPNDVAAFTNLLFTALQGNVGIGRYNESRLIYTSDQFLTASDEFPERRTIHLGQDIFMAAGSAVYAPLAGRVYCIQENLDPLDYGPTIILEHQTAEGIPFYTLYGHLSRESLKMVSLGQSVTKGQQIATLGEMAVNGGWPPHLHFQLITDMLGETSNFLGVAPPSQRAIWTSISPDPNLMLGIPESSFPTSAPSYEETLAERKKWLGKSLSISYDQPLKMIRGWQQYLYTETGQPYLDCVNNVCHVGHCHPQVVQAGQQQMTLLNTNTRYLHDNIIDYAKKLCTTLPEPLRICFFVCTGSEANDLALRMARTHTGQQDVITLDGAYHGHTQALIEISPYKFAGPGGKGAPDYVHTALMPDPYRGPYKRDDPAAGQKYAAHMQEMILNLQEQGKGIAGLIGESVLGCGGQVVLPDGYFQAAYEHVRAAGGICIADEVQVGFGRVGTHFWGFETQDVVPDIVTMGKPIGNGHPMAAVITTPEIAASFANGMEYFNTFGGNPVSCAIGSAVLDVIANEGLQENARQVGHYLLERLTALMDQFPLIGDVRGLGLFIGIELVLDRKTLEPAPQQASYIANRMKDHGILISTDGPLHNILKLKPPLVFSRANADFMVERLARVLAEDALQN